MKKFLKVFIIVLSVLAVIGGTTYFFFRKIEERNNTTGSIAAFLQSESKNEFDENLMLTTECVNSDGTDFRMELIALTSEKLDQIVYVLSTYHIEKGTKINNEQIANKLEQVKNSRNLLNRMMEEYNIKKDSAMFNRHLGANDLYIQACEYLVQYANLANLINKNLKVDRASDIKFNMFEIYANIVANDFSKINKDEANHTRAEINNASNINLMNSLLKIRNSYVVKIENEYTDLEEVTMLFTGYNNIFNTCYNKCDKIKFAKNLADNLTSATDPLQPTNERVATYYLRLIYGI